LKIFNKLIELPKEKYDVLINSVFNENHNWCMINIGSKRMYKGFDEIIFIDDSDNEIENK
jgi:hypothetical protein